MYKTLRFAIAALGMVFGQPVVADEAKPSPLETRALSPEKLAQFKSPAASLRDLDWLVGQWQGPGVGGAIASETWTQPIGGMMVGTFVQQNDAGAVMFTELMYLREVAGSVELRLKHFNADLTGWEEKDEVETYRLLALEPCAAFFQALTIRCAHAAAPHKGLVVAVRAGKNDAGAMQELVFRYRRPAFGSNARSYDCDGTTMEVNKCLGMVLERAQVRERQYLKAALGTTEHGSDVNEMISASDAAFRKYHMHECAAVYDQWREGTVRNAMSLRCSIRLTDQRTHTIWRNWLTYQDSSAPILPEPGPSR
ncbi:MAG: DUF6265 family protein [Pseudomonadota bacterium]